MKKSVFISHSSKDKRIADDICTRLELLGVGSWIAPRDVPAGGSYGQAIIDGIVECSVCLLLLSEASNKSEAVKSEVERAFHYQKVIVPLRIREVLPGKGIELFVSSSQWVDAFASPIASRIDYLAAVVQAAEGKFPQPAPPPQRRGIGVRMEQSLERALRYKMLSAAAAVLVLVMLGGASLWLQRGSQVIVADAARNIGQAALHTEAASTAIEGSATKLDEAGRSIQAVGLGIDDKLKNVKHEVASDPRKELANLGLKWAPDEYIEAVRANNTDAVKLFVDGNMILPHKWIRYFLFYSVDGVPTQSLSYIKAKNGFENAGTACKEIVADVVPPDSYLHIDIKEFAADPERSAIIRWLCALAPPETKKMVDDAIVAESADIMATRNYDTNRPQREKQCLADLRNEVSPHAMVMDVVNFTLPQTASAARKYATNIMGREISLGQRPFDQQRSYEKSIHEGCISQNEPHVVSDTRLDFLKDLRASFF